MPWFLALALFFAVAAALGVAGDRLGRATAAIACVPYIVVAGVAAVTYSEAVDVGIVEPVTWIPALGISADLTVDGLRLLLAAVVAGIGLLITIYTASYYTDVARFARFMAMLLLFSGGMLGIVLSANLFGLFVFWEITTVASYLLIGFDDDQAKARSAALQAVLVTTAGGLAMLAGFVVLAAEAGSASIADLGSIDPSSSAVSIALFLVFLGAFTKSAQVPFHFWLPGAMAAPTPASAYLHSATMVKAGVILLVLLAPAFSAYDAWLWVVTPVGLATMVWGALLALRQHDLKLLLAYGTVSQLGFMVALVGLDLVAAAVTVLVAHAVFKAGLFLVVGAVDKAYGTRDIRELQLGFLTAPLLAAGAGLLALSMAGLPPLLGFAAKEAAFDALVKADAVAPLLVIAAASVATVSYAIRFWWGGFGGRGPVATESKATGRALTAVPVLLASISLVVGLVPGWLGEFVSTATGQSVKVVLWPGFTVALGVSAAVAVLGGAAGWWLFNREDRHEKRRGPSAAGSYAAALRGLNRLADTVTGFVQNGSLPTYLAVIVTTVVVVPASVWIVRWDGAVALPLGNGVAEAVLVVALVAGALAAARAQRRLAAVLMLGLVGYCVAGIYVLFGAPDLALTQVLVETLTVALFALVLVRLPRRFGAEPRSLSHRTRLLVAAAVGVFATTAAVVITSVTPAKPVAAAYVDNAVGAGGTNVVNVILTNFRALDTLGEITVLAAAAVGIGALVSAARKPAEERR